MVFADMSQQQLSIWTGVLALLAWKRLKGVMAASVKVQALLLDTAIVTVLTPVRLLLTVSPAVSEQRAAIDRRI